MKPANPRRPGKSILRPQGYKKHYITFFRYYDSEDTLRYRIDSEPPTDTELYLDSETHEVITSLAADDFFDRLLFHNTQAVVRWARQVGRPVKDAA
jgi:hypothetical protein